MVINAEGWYDFRIGCAEVSKKQAEGGVGRYYQDKMGGIQEVV